MPLLDCLSYVLLHCSLTYLFQEHHEGVLAAIFIITRPRIRGLGHKRYTRRIIKYNQIRITSAVVLCFPLRPFGRAVESTMCFQIRQHPLPLLHHEQTGRIHLETLSTARSLHSLRLHHLTCCRVFLSFRTRSSANSNSTQPGWTRDMVRRALVLARPSNSRSVHISLPP